MDLAFEPRCERTSQGKRCLACISEMYQGDNATRMKRVEALIAQGDLDGADALLRNLDFRGVCNEQVSGLWRRLGQAMDAAGKKSKYPYAKAAECSKRR